MAAVQGRDGKEQAAEVGHTGRSQIMQVDAIVTSVNQVGFFADAGPLPLFVSSHVSANMQRRWLKY